MEGKPTCLRGLFSKDDDGVHPLVDNDIFKACPNGMRFDTKEVRYYVAGLYDCILEIFNISTIHRWFTEYSSFSTEGSVLTVGQMPRYIREM